MSYTNAIHLGSAHKEWLSSLDFYKTEIEILEKRLSEVLNKNTGHDATAKGEHFQNQFIVQKNNIDELKHSINDHAHSVFLDVQKHVGRVHETRVDDHARLEDEVASFEKIVNALRHDFNHYLSLWF